MNREEWLEVAATVIELWPNSRWTSATVDRGFLLVRDLEGGLVAAAVVDLVSDPGRNADFPPSVPAIRQRAMQLQRPPELWAEVWSEILGRVGTHGHQGWDEIHWSPALVEFIVHVGYDSFKQLGLSDESELSVSEGQWRRKWEAWQARSVRQEGVASLVGLGARTVLGSLADSSPRLRS